jgi:hypothetical protein
VDGAEQVRYFLMKSGLNVVSCPSYFNQAQVDYNYQVASQTMGEQHYRVPWRDDIQLRQFRCEIESAMGDGPERFRLTPARAEPAARRGFFGRLLRRA